MLDLWAKFKENLIVALEVLSFCNSFRVFICYEHVHLSDTMNVLRFALLLVLALLGLASAQNLGSSDEKLIRQRRGYRNRRDTTVKIVAQPPLLLNSSNTLPVFKKIE
uniref:Uncharacterized protein n=1 Tax=Bursaphelenchus xylophilus TaxID=6326 RepID=A0A1I7RID8_BURXY